MILTDITFKRLMAEEKRFKDKTIKLPLSNERKNFEIICVNSSEKLFLDINRSGKIELRKATLQHRYTEPLVRIDLDSPPHMNPDGTKVSRNHIHVFKEGFGDAWAYELATFKDYKFREISDFSTVFTDLCQYCNIQLPETQMIF